MPCKHRKRRQATHVRTPVSSDPDSDGYARKMNEMLTRYDMLHHMYVAAYTAQSIAVVRDAGTHICTPTCTLKPVYGKCYRLIDGSEHTCLGLATCTLPRREHTSVICELGDLYVCEHTLVAHVCCNDVCRHSTATSEGNRCELTGRHTSTDPVYTRGWQDDTWRTPAPAAERTRPHKVRGASLPMSCTSTARQLVTRLKNTTLVDETHRLVFEVARAVVVSVFPRGPKRIAYERNLTVTMHATTIATVQKYVALQLRSREPVFLDRVSELCRSVCFGIGRFLTPFVGVCIGTWTCFIRGWMTPTTNTWSTRSERTTPTSAPGTTSSCYDCRSSSTSILASMTLSSLCCISDARCSGSPG
jgi:hypothetical protein